MRNRTPADKAHRRGRIESDAIVTRLTNDYDDLALREFLLRRSLAELDDELAAATTQLAYVDGKRDALITAIQSVQIALAARELVSANPNQVGPVTQPE